jgi:hypothetical protein
MKFTLLAKISGHFFFTEKVMLPNLAKTSLGDFFSQKHPVTLLGLIAKYVCM